MKNQLELENVFFFDAVPKSQMQNIIMDMNCSMAPLKKIDLFKGAIPTKIFENLALKASFARSSRRRSKGFICR